MRLCRLTINIRYGRVRDLYRQFDYEGPADRFIDWYARMELRYLNWSPMFWDIEE